MILKFTWFICIQRSYLSFMKVVLILNNQQITFCSAIEVYSMDGNEEKCEKYV